MAKSKVKAKRSAQPVRKSKPVVKAKSKPRKIRANTWPRQLFHVCHLREQDFDQGLRLFWAFNHAEAIRDLGLADATGRKVQAHVIRMTKPFDGDKVSVPHYHDVDFQMVYVLKGWFSSQFDGNGTHTFKAGSCWIQPHKIKHTVMGYSEDIVLPAEFDTVTFGAKS